MKNVLLVGDSIRIGYDKSVKKSLEGIANVYFPEENCRFASYLLRNLHEYRSLIEYGTADVIYFNAGLWDSLRLFEEEPHTPIDVYAYYMERICVRIKKLFPNAKVIFATSTKVISEQMNKNFKRYNEDTINYNRVAVEIVKKHGFMVSDLYSISDALPESAHSDACHYYTPLATKAFATEVLKCVCNALGVKEVEYKEVLHGEKPIGT